MGLFARIFSNPRHQLAIAADSLRRGRTQRAVKAADSAIGMLQRRLHKGGTETRELLSDAWFIKGRVALLDGKRDEAFRSFFASAERVPDDDDALAFVVDQALLLGEIPIQLYPALVGYVAHAGFRQESADHADNVERIRKLLRPRPDEPASLDALEPFNAALRDRLDDCAWCRYHLGIVAAARNNWSDACTVLNQAIALDPHADAPRRLNAYALLQLGRPREALDALADMSEHSPRRGTLLLTAHLEMVAGSMANAAQAYQGADELRELGRKDSLAYAETLLRCSQTGDAVRIIDRAEGALAPREHVLHALVFADKGPITEVRDALAAAFDDADTRQQAAGAALAIAITHTDKQGTFAVLAQVPDALRDDRYQVVYGCCLAAHARWPDAQAAWSRVSAQRPVLAEAEEIARLNGLIDRYNVGDLAGIVVHAGTRMAPPGEIGRQMDRLLQLTLWRLYDQAKGGSLDGALLPALAQLIETSHRPADAPDLAKLLGATFAAAGDDERALELLRGASGADAALIGARSALRLDRPLIAMKLLRGAEPSDSRRRRLMALAFARSKDWDAAVDALGTDLHDDLAVAILFLAGRTDELLAATSSDSATSYFKAVSLLRIGKNDAGREALQRVAAASGFRDPADHLAGWLDLRDAAAALAARDIRKVQERLASAARNWPGPEGAMAALPGGEDALLSLLIPANDRVALKRALSEQAERAGLADPLSCHRLAILHLVDGSASHGRGEYEAAIGAWESAIGCLAVVIAGRSYMGGWRAGRGTAYAIQLPDDFDLGKAVQAFCAKLFDEAANAMREHAAVTRNASQQPALVKAAERAAKLSLMLEAELYAAELLAGRDGFDIAGRSAVCGPAALTSSELASEFGEYCFDMAEIEGRPEEFAALDSSGADWALGGTLTELEYFFSSLRLPAMLLRKGNLDEARRHLSEPSCFPLCQPNRCSKGPLNGCPGQGSRFMACNPAFARDNGTDDLRHAARGLKLTVLLRIAERGLKQKDPVLAELKTLWDEAAELAAACDQSEHAMSSIRGLVLGRAETLLRDDRLELAHELVHAAYESLHDEELENELARLTTNRAIDIANKTDDFDQTVKLLRDAYRMTPHQPRVRMSLVIALQRLAPKKFRDDSAAGRALLEEARGIALLCLKDDPYNTEVADTLVSIEEDLITVLRVSAVEIRDKSDVQAGRFLRTALEIGLESTRRPQTRGRNDELVAQLAKDLAMTSSNIGVDIANRKDEGGIGVGFKSDDAVKYLTAAWMLDPGALTIAKNFAGILRIEGIAAFKVSSVECVEYLRKSIQVGKTWLRTGNDPDVRRIVSQSEDDLAQIGRALGGAHRLPASSTPLPSPSIDGGLDFLKRNRLL